MMSAHSSGPPADIAAPRIFDPATVNVFVAFQMVSWIGHAGMLITALIGSNVRRHITWYNFVASWMFSGLSYSLLTLAGQQFSRELNSALCFIQAILIYASPGLTSSTSLALIINLWFNLKSMLRGDRESAQRRDIMLIIYPYFAFFLLFLVALVQGALTGVYRADERAYCVVSSNVPGKTAAALVATTTIVVLVFTSCLIVLLYRNWRFIRGHGVQGSQYLSMAVRMSVFTALALLAMIVSFIIFALPTTQRVDVVLATIPLASLFVFSTQIDLFRVWMFWRKAPCINPMHVEVDVEKKQTGA